MAITPLPPAPLPTDSTSEFNSKAFAFVGALDGFVTETNALAVQVDADAATAAEGAEAAEAALGAANFKGEWSTLTGALAIPASVSHNGSVWVLTQSLADVTSNEPGVDSPNYWINVTPQQSTAGTLQAIATGSLSDGSTVIINADGTVSAVSGVNQGFGSAAVFESAATSVIAGAYDSTNNRVVIAYSDGGNSSYGTAVVGTVSGTSISFGTPVVFESASTNTISVCFHAALGKIVIAYRDQANSQYGTAIVGTVSGTSISFGTAVVFESAATTFISANYHPIEQKIVIVYRGVSNYGYAILGTVSGTSIGFGAAVSFSGTTAINAAISTYDSDDNKILIFYRTTNGFGVATTVSDTSITFGTAVSFDSWTTAIIGAAYNPIAQKTLVVYWEQGGSNYMLAKLCTCSSGVLSFGDATTILTTNISSPHENYLRYDAKADKIVMQYRLSTGPVYLTNIKISGSELILDLTYTIVSTGSTANYVIYDSTAEKIISAYQDGTNSNYGTAKVVTTSYSNMTSENYIGISNASYTNGQTATVQIVGSVDDAQTSLTAGQSYYIQNDGTLSTTASVPSVFAGTAVSATKLIVKG